MKIPQDKIAHFLAGMGAAALTHPFGIPITCLTVASAAVLKELWDYQGYGTPGVADALVTLAGGAALVMYYEALAGRLPEHWAAVQGILS